VIGVHSIVAHAPQHPPPIGNAQWPRSLRDGHASPDATVLTLHLPDGECGSGRLLVSGVLACDVLKALRPLAISAFRSGCAELVVDVSGLTDFPVALFAELNTLAREHPGAVRLVGLDEAVAAVCRPALRSAQHGP
jgi:hypothetical protein